VKKGQRHTAESRALISKRRRDYERLVWIMSHPQFEVMTRDTSGFELRVQCLIDMADDSGYEMAEHEARRLDMTFQDTLLSHGIPRQPA